MELVLPDPPLRNSSVALREWNDDDARAVVDACQDPLISEFSPVIPRPYRTPDAHAWLAGQASARREGRMLELAVESPDSGELLGAVALSNVDLEQRSAGMGYWLAQHARGRGHASEAVRLLAAWAFESLGLARLELVTHPENLASQRVADRCGFVREGVLRSHMVVRHSGQRRDSAVYGMLAHELR